MTLSSTNCLQKSIQFLWLLPVDIHIFYLLWEAREIFKQLFYYYWHVLCFFFASLHPIIIYIYVDFILFFAIKRWFYWRHVYLSLYIETLKIKIETRRVYTVYNIIMMIITRFQDKIYSRIVTRRKYQWNETDWVL